ncbi:hypothetical protein EJ06DRAFT_525328 [Trichodelitschia bisporula]|uniref:Uncharacterized protein n=1 Tax=Trichodelitschia bisporula TaxID=703511 RepID=A0A6G1HIB9_9PEZI|nr:hypothetical protein EJ06DRAFT_525328 [Trichodelitschia bisporula]
MHGKSCCHGMDKHPLYSFTARPLQKVSTASATGLISSNHHSLRVQQRSHMITSRRPFKIIKMLKKDGPPSQNTRSRTRTHTLILTEADIATSQNTCSRTHTPILTEADIAAALHPAQQAQPVNQPHPESGIRETLELDDFDVLRAHQPGRTAGLRIIRAQEDYDRHVSTQYKYWHTARIEDWSGQVSRCTLELTTAQIEEGRKYEQRAIDRAWVKYPIARE